MSAAPTTRAMSEPRRARRWPRALLLSALAFVVVLVGYGATLAPAHVAHLQERVADGSESIDLGGDAALIAPEGWVVRPLVRELISWPPLPPLLDWSVIFDAQTGVVLTSPDGVLSVEISDSSSWSRSGAVEEFGVARLKESGEITDFDMVSERLASDASLLHLDGDRVVFGTLMLNQDSAQGPAVGFLARTNGANIDGYRPALSEMLESVALAD
ncbi:hypothetical protein [Leucobacter japonicus]|uniref:hypothetical protein n=1 Tax=Leucobacter japonicus TaxID=1461259 RepID=UPI0006A79A29|nr:hypothetical protein [Leucobacter japonicus]